MSNEDVVWVCFAEPKEVPPYGYYHIYKEYGDGSWWLEATVDTKLGEQVGRSVATVIANALNKKAVYGLPTMMADK